MTDTLVHPAQRQRSESENVNSQSAHTRGAIERYRTQVNTLRESSETETSDLSVSQRILAKAYAQQMKVGVWTGYEGRRKYKEDLQIAKQANQRVIAEKLNSESEGLSSDDKKQAAIVATVDNLHTVSSLSTEEYAGKKSGRFITWVRNRGPFLKGAAASASTFGFGLIAGFGGSMLVADRIRRGYVANDVEGIKSRHSSAIEGLESDLSVIDPRSFSETMVFEKQESLLDTTLRDEQKRAAIETSPIATGAFIGAAVLAAGALIQGGYEAGIASVE